MENALLLCENSIILVLKKMWGFEKNVKLLAVTVKGSFLTKSTFCHTLGKALPLLKSLWAGLWAQPVGLTCFHFEIMARNPGSTKPTPASCCLQATEHCREELRVTELGMSSPFLANTIPGNARDEHQEWPEGAAPAPAAAQVLSLGLPLSALHCSCTQQITQDFSMH